MTPVDGGADVVPEFARATIAVAGRTVRVHDLYTDPFGAALYDDLVEANTDEIFEILAAVRPHPGDILELAAGSGRITIPLLANGRRVTAVDNSAEMLALLDTRIATARRLRGTCRPVCADMVTYADPDRTHTVAVISATSISLLGDDDRRAMLFNLAAQLHPGALLVVSTVHSTPGYELESHVSTTAMVGASGRGITAVESWPPDAPAREVLLVRTDDIDSTADELDICLSTVRVVSPDVLHDEIQTAGFTVTRTRVVSAANVRHRHVLFEAILS